MIRIEGLRKRLGDVTVLDGIDLHVAKGEVLALVGSSGAGKSVLLKHVIGLLEPDAGEILVEGRSVVRADARELADIRRRVGYVFQDAALLDSLTVWENLRLALSDGECARDPLYPVQRIRDALRLVNLPPNALDRLPRQLSGGMRKRVGIARALLNRPAVMLYDEPTTGLDPANVEIINRLVLRTRDEYGATSVVITHDLTSIHSLANRVALLGEGRLQFLGTPTEFLAQRDDIVAAFVTPQLRTSYWRHHGYVHTR